VIGKLVMFDGWIWEVADVGHGVLRLLRDDKKRGLLYKEAPEHRCSEYVEHEQDS